VLFGGCSRAYPDVLFGSDFFLSRLRLYFAIRCLLCIVNAFGQGEIPSESAQTIGGLPFLAPWNTLVPIPGFADLSAFATPWSLRLLLSFSPVLAGMAGNDCVPLDRHPCLVRAGLRLPLKRPFAELPRLAQQRGALDGCRSSFVDGTGGGGKEKSLLLQ